MYLWTSLLAVLVERFLPYAGPIQRRIGHPVQWVGQLINWLDTNWNDQKRSASMRRLRGTLALIVLVVGVGLVVQILASILRVFPFGWVVEGALASILLASRQLAEMVSAVGKALQNSLAEGRAAVSHIVGRDTSELNEPEVSRAAIETLAENASDGFVAPLFFLILFGLPGIAVYKAVNTADSMIGHKSDRYRDFGWASARFDDLLNFVPARLTALLFAAASWLLPGASAARAWTTIFDDAHKHASPNAGWPEAAMAGALDLGLGGARTYQGEVLDLPQMGQGRRDLGPTDIERAVALYWRLWLICVALVAVLAIVRLFTA